MNERALILTVAVIAVVAIIAIALIAVRRSKRKRSERLRRDFGPEYDRVVIEHQDQARAEATLEARQKRAAKIIIHPVTAEDRDRYAEAWRSVQARFVDNPGEAVIEADRLLERLMSQLGYPMGDFEQQAADISVDHPRVVQNYRLAHETAGQHQTGKASTEDLRQAMVCYHSLYEELLEPHLAIQTEVKK